ncbi:Putative DNA-binding domain-containing protein [Pseudomonas oryzae]|uniref:Putative DNA-binding domain-containing protein n=2 Tax=Pseudomonas oryzae TaxID=1392877 RepID=A0A1H1NZX9_9PSED|nr:Putative DNA-binding domain-containing protein [Pseudomonas oryzae]
MSQPESEEQISHEPESERSEKRTPIYQIQLEDLSVEHIDEIKMLEEGWFVEFKSIFTDTAKIAKSISSFANAYGGVLIVGVQEAAKGRKFDHFTPLSKNEAEETILRLRHAVEAHLSPCPFFESKLIAIPEFGVADPHDKWIVFVKIPKGEKAPYLHSSGAVYTRKGDSSSPVALTDQGLLERLWSDRTKKVGEIESRINFLREQSASDLPRLDIFIARTVSPRRAAGAINFKDFIDVASQPVFPGNPPLLDNFYPIDSSFVARRTEGTLDNYGIMWDFDWHRYIHHIHIPLACHEWDGSGLNNERSGNERIAALEDYLATRKEFEGKRIFIVDLTLSIFIMSAIFYMVSKLHLNRGDEDKFAINIKASSIRKVVVYSDLPRYKEHLEKMGLPFVHRDIGFLSSSMNPDDWLEFPIAENNKVLYENANLDVRNAFLNFIDMAQALGISRHVLLGQHDRSSGESTVSDLLDAFGRIISTSFSYSCSPNPAS